MTTMLGETIYTRLQLGESGGFTDWRGAGCVVAGGKVPILTYYNAPNDDATKLHAAPTRLRKWFESAMALFF